MTPTFAAVSHEQFVADVLALADALLSDGDWQPSFLIGVGRGGLIPAVYLSHAVGIPTLSCDLSSQVKDFAEEVLIRLASRARGGEKLLFVDDINDSGRTIGLLRSGLANGGAPPGSVRFATLLDNSTSKEPIDYRGRMIDRTSDKKWFVFPWEALAPTDAIAREAVAVPERLG